MTNTERWKIVCDYVILDDETGDNIGISDKAPEDVKKVYAEMIAEEKEIDDFTDFAMANIAFDEQFKPTGVRDGAPPDTMDRYNAFVEKFGAFPPPDEY